MATIDDYFDNTLAESFFATLLTELLDRQSWATRDEPAHALLGPVERFSNPRRRHSTFGCLSPTGYERAAAT